jgi:hypothetical protein
MADVNLVLKANNSDYVNKMQEAQKATQKVYDTAEKGSAKQKGLIEQEIANIEKLSRWRMKTTDPKMVAEYNRAIEESTEKLREMDTVGTKAAGNIEKSGKSMVKSVGAWGTAFAAVSFVLAGVVKAFKETEMGLKAFNFVGAITKQIFYDIATSAKISLKGIELAIAANRELQALRTQQRRDLISMAKEQAVYNELYLATSDQTKTNAEKLKIIDQAMLSHEVIVAKRIQNLKDEREQLITELAAKPDNTKIIDALIAKEAELITAESEGNLEVKRLESQRTGIIKDENEKRKKEIHDYNLWVYNYAMAEYKRLQDAMEKLKKSYENLGPTSMKGSTTGLFTNIFFGEEGWDKEKNEFTQEYQVIVASTDAFQKKYLVNMQAWAKTKEALSESIKDQNKKRTAEEKKDWDDKVQAIRDSVALIENILGRLADAQLEDAQRNREILDQRISELQEELQTETELYKAGYASNVNAKKHELAKTKQLRDQALAEEAAALKKKRAVEAISQGIDIASAISGIIGGAFKGGKKPWWVSLISAGAGIGAMFLLLSGQKKNIPAAVGYAKGGWTGDGSERDHTGERVAGVVHEREFVIRKGPAHRFRDVLDAINRDDKKMIFNRFNKLSPELMGGTTVNNVAVNNDGSNSRLDKLITENLKLNTKLSEGSMMDLGNRVIIKKGNTIRTIRR